jgi:hypothetical protein
MQPAPPQGQGAAQAMPPGSGGQHSLGSMPSAGSPPPPLPGRAVNDRDQSAFEARDLSDTADIPAS